MRLKLVSVLLFSFSYLLLSGAASAASDSLRERLEGLRLQSNPVVAGAPLASVRLLDDFYQRRGYRYAWRSSAQVKDLLRLVGASVDEGLRLSDFNAREIEGTVGSLPPADFPASERADVDILLSDSLLRLVHHLRYGKVDPRRLEKTWSQSDGPYAADLVDDLERAVAARNLQTEVDGLTSKPRFYTRLKQALARYRKIVAAGGWPTVGGGKLLKPGMSDPRVPVMRERLRISGEYKGSASKSSKYDADLESAVLTFQKRHDLGADGVVGPATLAAMNVSAEARVNQIRVNLERMRWVSDKMPGEFLLVDIAGQKAQLIHGSKVVWSSRVIVGQRKRPTPVFRDQIEYLDLNPTWTVPPTILEKDILPAMRKNPAYLKKKGLEVVTREGEPVSPSAVNWYAPAASFPYLVRQPPGTSNALGRIKFIFPNRYSVYLHDTPHRDLFSKPQRLFSSGCVRVERPWELAELVLNDPQHWSRKQLEEAAESNRTKRLRLPRPLPVVLAYWTAEVGADGQVEFREDVYARDAAVLSALDGTGPFRVVYQEPGKTEPAGTGLPAGKKARKPTHEPTTMSNLPLRRELIADH